ncbi:MAG: hypothetical protein ACM3WU_06365 [Bacillota bacterium]
MRGPRALFAVAAGTILLAVCSALLAFTNPPIELGIKTQHAPGSFRRGVLTEVPVYDEATRHPFQVDLRHYDLRNVDLTGRLQDLIHADFDVYTQWPTDKPCLWATWSTKINSGTTSS